MMIYNTFGYSLVFLWPYMNASLVKILISYARTLISRVIPSAIKFLPYEDNDHFCQQVDLKGNPFRKKMPLRIQVT